MLSHNSDQFNGQIHYYLNISAFDLSLNLPYITIYITNDWIMEMRHKSEWNSSNSNYWGVSYYTVSHVTASSVSTEKISS